MTRVRGNPTSGVRGGRRAVTLSSSRTIIDGWGGAPRVCVAPSSPRVVARRTVTFWGEHVPRRFSTYAASTSDLGRHGSLQFRVSSPHLNINAGPTRDCAVPCSLVIVMSLVRILPARSHSGTRPMRLLYRILPYHPRVRASWLMRGGKAATRQADPIKCTGMGSLGSMAARV